MESSSSEFKPHFVRRWRLEDSVRFAILTGLAATLLSSIVGPWLIGDGPVEGFYRSAIPFFRMLQSPWLFGVSSALFAMLENSATPFPVRIEESLPRAPRTEPYGVEAAEMGEGPVDTEGLFEVVFRYRQDLARAVVTICLIPMIVVTAVMASFEPSPEEYLMVEVSLLCGAWCSLPLILEHALRRLGKFSLTATLLCCVPVMMLSLWFWFDGLQRHLYHGERTALLLILAVAQSFAIGCRPLIIRMAQAFAGRCLASLPGARLHAS